MQVQRYPESYVIEQYLGAVLSEESQHLFVSPDRKRLIAVSDQNSKEQSKLFSEVISKLELEDPFYSILKDFEVSSETHNIDAYLITLIFLERYSRLPLGKETNAEDHYRYHRKTLSAALKDHQNRYFIPDDPARRDPPPLEPLIPLFTFYHSDDPEASKFIANLSLECMEYWLYAVKMYKRDDVLSSLKEKLKEKELLHLEQSPYNHPKNFIIFLQERVIKALNSSKNHVSAEDLYRTLKYSQIIDCHDNTLFKYEEFQGESDPISRHDCSQFEKFLTCLIKLIEEPDQIKDHEIIKAWKTCIDRTIINCEANLFTETIEKFLPYISNTGIYTLLHAFLQDCYSIPSHFIAKSLHKTQELISYTDTSYKFKFTYSQKIKIHIYNTLEILMQDRSKAKSNIENNLTRNPLNLTPWNCKITVHVVSANKNCIKKNLTKPFEKLGLLKTEGKSISANSHWYPKG